MIDQDDKARIGDLRMIYKNALNEDRHPGANMPQDVLDDLPMPRTNGRVRRKVRKCRVKMLMDYSVVWLSKPKEMLDWKG